MIHNTTIKNLIKSSDSITSTHLVVGEWNMNRYQKISQYGIYKGSSASTHNPYSSGDADIVSGKTFYVYDDDSTQESPTAEYYSSLASVFQPDRPDPGIVLTQYYPGALLVNDSKKTRASRLSVDNPRFYPMSKNRQYDYFNSAKLIDTSITVKEERNQFAGVSTVGGGINHANPFVVYENTFPCNKITIKVQEYRSVPRVFYVDILVGSTWQNIYSANSVSVWDDGVLEIYNNNGTWSKTVNRITDLNEISNPSSQAVSIKGIRLRVAQMSEVTAVVNTVQRKFRSSLELIEISPRLEVDFSDFTENFSFNSAIADGDFGLPVGKIVSSNGNISISNETEAFLYSSSAAAFNLLSPDVEFRFFQTVSGSNVPLKVMYSDRWDINEDFTADVALSDKMRIFQETNVTDMCLVTKDGIPLSVIVLMLLDNLGITGYEFKKSNNSSDSEDTKIQNFFCNKEQTLADVLEKLAIATQSAMFFDAVGNLNILTKERICRTEELGESTTSASGGTDFWAIYDENFVAGDAEYPYIQNYKANVVSAQEEKIDPVTDGTVTYHAYGIRKKPGQSIIKDSIPKNILDDMPANSIVGTGYDYTFKTPWSVGSDNSAVLGAANLLRDVSIQSVKDQFSSTYDAINEDGAVIQMVNEAISAATAGNDAKQKALLIYLDRNEIYTFPEMSGYVMIDNEIIGYNGMVYSVNGTRRVVFSREELNEIINTSDLRGAIIPIALVVDVRFGIVQQKGNGKYEYRVNGDGRAQFETKKAAHKAFNENNLGVEPSDRFSLIIGGKPNQQAPGEVPKVTANYDFSKVSAINKLKKVLRLPDQNYTTYLGYLRISGNKSPLRDRRALSASTDAEVLKAQEKIDREVDKLVPGKEFDPYVYTLGERFIYGQKIDLDFAPNIIGTTMRLYSPRKNKKGNVNEMTTNSSIAGIGFGLKTRRQNGKTLVKSGYFIEVETIGSAKDFAASEAFKNNLRFYKIVINDNGKMEPQLLAVGQVNAYTVSNLDAAVVAGQGTSGDPVFDLEVRMSIKGRNVEYKIYYGGQDISPKKAIKEKIQRGYFTENKNIFMFVRNDSQAIYENIYAALKPAGSDSNDTVFKEEVEFDEILAKGSIAQTKQYLFKDRRYKFYYNDFGKIVRQVRKYTPRYTSPTLFSRLIDVSRINPQYMIQSQRYTAFGAEIVVVNTSNTAIALTEESDLPLFILGPQLEELSTGDTNVADFYEKIDDDGKRATDVAYNKSLYGNKGFNIDSPYIQSVTQSKNLLRWILRNCNRQRFKISMEMMPNPLIELGDKVKVFSADRGYRAANSAAFGNKTFVVSEINRSVTTEGPQMNVTLIEVGEK